MALFEYCSVLTVASTSWIMRLEDTLWELVGWKILRMLEIPTIGLRVGTQFRRLQAVARKWRNAFWQRMSDLPTPMKPTDRSTSRLSNKMTGRQRFVFTSLGPFHFDLMMQPKSGVKKWNGIPLIITSHCEAVMPWLKLKHGSTTHAKIIA